MAGSVLDLALFLSSFSVLVAFLGSCPLLLFSFFFFSLFGAQARSHCWAPRNKQSSAAACISDGGGMGSRYRLARRPKLTDRIWISAGWACRARHCAAAAWKTTAMGVAWSKFSFLAPPWLRLFVLLGVLLLGRDVDFTWQITHQKYLMTNKDFKSLQLRIKSFVYALFFSLQLGK